METWRMLAVLTGVLVLYAVGAAVFGYQLTVVDVVVGLLFGGLGIYLGDVLSERLDSDRE